MVFGRNCGFQTLLVETGMSKFENIETLMQNPEDNFASIPDFYMESLGDLRSFLTEK